MECNKDEAIRAKGLAEKKMVNNDFEGARNIALKARNLYPELENISQLITVCEVHCSSLKKINGAEKDLYGILQIETVADEATIRKQYRKLALALHPDKNKFPGAEAAFKLIGEANMILSDKGKRSLYDVKCRQPMKAPATKPQKPQTHGSYARKQFAGQNNNFNSVPSSHFNGVNHHQQQQQPPVSSLRPSFWTYCPFCNIKYEYYREFVNRPLRCQHCSKLFIAYDISAAGGVPGSRFAHEENQSANLGSNRAQPQPQPPFSHTEEVKRREKVKVNIQKDGQSSHFTHQTSNTKPEAAGSSKTVPKPMKTEPSKDTKKKRGRKIGAESGESSSDAEGGNGFGPAGNGVNYRKSSRQKPQVSYNEDAAVDESSPLKRSRKSSDDVEDAKAKKEKEKVSGNADVGKEGHGSMPNGNHVNLDDDDDDDDDDEPEFVNCPDLEFSNFDKDKEEDCFAVDQIWACYDSIDGMPRFYAKIRKVFKTQFKLKITWLEADPDDESEIKWAEEGLPVGCGKFMGGESEETKDRLMFSHQIVYKNGLKRNSFVIYPQKGEIWALFKDWDIKWGSDPENHSKFKFDIVEILDVHANGSVSVALLVKVKGFVSLFKKTAWGGLNDRKIPGNEHLRFSHRIPSTKLTGAERAGVPPGSFELDTASLPDDLGDYYYSINPDNNNSNNNNNNATTPKKNVNPEGKNGIDKDTLNVRRSPRGLKNPSDATATATATSSKGSNAFCEDGNLPKNPKIIHDFSADTQIWKFHKGQIWAILDTSNGVHQCYVKIIQIETPPFRLQVSFLKSCNNQSTVCGLFKATPGKTKPLPPEVFSHVVKAEENGPNFSIYPREQQIWALNKRQDADCECEIVEVLESDESSVKVMSLTHVPGYKSVYKAPRVQRSSDNIVVIPQKEINRFSRRIPAFLFTEEKDGALRGCWELNPAALKGLPLKGFSGGQPN